MTINIPATFEIMADNLFDDVFNTFIERPKNEDLNDPSKYARYPKFDNMMKICKYDREFKSMYDGWGEQYISAYYLLNYGKIDLTNVKPYEPNSKKRSPIKSDIYSRFTTCTLDLSKPTLEEAMKKNQLY